ncbi:MAG: aminoglycoside phosphotransferase, partial [Nocardioidaceae bacterium]
MHADQLTVTADMVKRLVHEQFPAWRQLPLLEVASEGTVNAIFRVGDDLAARFPLRAQDAVEAREWLESEASAA